MRRKLLMLDICCGGGGWSKGFIANGWKCIGWDWKNQPAYPGKFQKRDVMTVLLADIEKINPDFICASTSCEQFSVFRMAHFFPAPKFPREGLLLFNYVRYLCERSGIPYIMENVGAAQQFVGPGLQHCGPFYFWGSAVPPIFPSHLYSVVKGCFQPTREQAKKKDYTKLLTHHDVSSRHRSRTCSVIPFDLAFYVAQQARNLVISRAQS